MKVKLDILEYNGVTVTFRGTHRLTAGKPDFENDWTRLTLTKRRSWWVAQGKPDTITVNLTFLTEDEVSALIPID